MAYDRIYLSPPHMSGDEQQFISEAFRTNWIAPLGNNVDQFEKEISTYVDSDCSLALSSGTAAIHLALRLLNIERNDIVLCSALTFIASANPILYEGAIPVFIDSEPETWNMSPRALERAIEHYRRIGVLPKAVIVVNLYGQSADYNEILEICCRYGVPIIEDAAESLGSMYHGKKSGTFGKFGVFSFNGNKIITTSGGGMLVSDDHDLIEKGRFLSTQARDKALHYEHSQIGYNYRLSNVLAGIGRGQLLHIEERVRKRREIFKKYKHALGSIEGIAFMPEPEHSRSNRWLTAILLDPSVLSTTPIELIDGMENFNIEARPIWKPLHLQPIFKNNHYFPHEEEQSVSAHLFNTGLCLPSGSSLTPVDQDRIIAAIKDVLSKKILK
ncbi:DegT/DnrJ/EryC1/StrS family aminotransferase [Falsibacillus albus]|uniref:Pyridoxal phosphate-dependent aminotransferase n=1 Tax=Falsibacillus albus TaxID=2478915 RepID=A0A3L7K4F0_9BACI|nr:DegT/DnrJ/EryC1/StrS family aminotransferase [Falsibacillus albus]RLQ97525.1 pyridoxal phosphate-dependent aminotransferase [Falsibacillus albus]